MRSVDALVTPRLLEWARHTAGFSLEEAAARLGRNPEEVRAWESGDSRPTYVQAKKAAGLYQRPLAVFYMEEPPSDFETLKDFRRLPEYTDREWPRQALIFFRAMQEKQEWLSRFLADSDASELAFVASRNINHPATEFAQEILQTIWPHGTRPGKYESRRELLVAWIERAEAAGIYVFKAPGIDTEVFRGYVIADKLAPVIVLNSRDALVGQLFSLVHELVHLWLGASAVSNHGTRGKYSDSTLAKQEWFCNKVASLCLLPPTIAHDIMDNAINRYQDVSDAVASVSRRFKISEEAVARRFLDRGIISSLQYRELREFYQERWAEKRFKQQERQKASDRGPSFFVTKNSQLSSMFLRQVVMAYASEHVTGRDASALLGTKINKIPKLASAAGIENLVSV